MMKHFWNRIVRKNENSCRKEGTPKRRTLRLETLEDRQLLAVTAGLPTLPAPTAASYVVTTAADTVDATDNVLSLREALAAAATGDTITFDTTAMGNTTITLSSIGDLEITTGVTIDAQNQNITIEGNGSDRVLYVTTTDTAELIGLTITGGFGRDTHNMDYRHSDSGRVYGGGIYSEGSLILTDCKVTGNEIEVDYGGGIYNSGTMVLNGCEVSLNKIDTTTSNTTEVYGGGIYNTGTLTLDNTSVDGNSTVNNYSASYMRGIGIYNAPSATLTIKNESSVSGNIMDSPSLQSMGGGIYNDGDADITDCTISQNLAVSGSGVYNSNSATSLTMTDCVISQNAHNIDFEDPNTDGSGGGLYNSSYYDTFLSNCTFSNNHSIEGGAIYSEGVISMTDNCEVSDNTATYGGGIYVAEESITAEDVSFLRNSATKDGGAIYNYWGEVTLTTCSFTGNSADDGGAIYNDDTITLESTCVFTGNEASEGGGVYNALNGNATLTSCIFGGDTASDGNTAEDYGGGVYNLSNATLNNCVFKNNQADYGGGVYTSAVEGAEKQINLNGCSFENNIASTFGGGLINLSKAYLTDCDFKENSAVKGGAISNHSTLEITITDAMAKVSFDGNFATKAGGAIYNSRGSIEIIGSSSRTDADFSGNHSNGGAGAIFNYGGTTCNLSDLLFDRNYATSDGGAIYSTHLYSDDLVANAAITNCDFTGNYSISGSGGAIGNWGTMEITGGTFSSNGTTTTNNANTKYGGAIHNGNFLKNNYTGQEITDSDYDSTLTIGGTTFTGNGAEYGGAVYSNATLTLNVGAFTSNTATENGGAIVCGIDGAATLSGAISLTTNSAKVGGGIFASSEVTLSSATITFTDNSLAGDDPDPDYGADVAYNKSNTYEWAGSVSEMDNVKPFTYVVASPSTLAEISTSVLFADQAFAAEDTTLYMDVDGSGNYVEVGETFSAAQLGLTSGESAVNFLYVTGSGSVGGTLKLNVGDATPEISSVASAGVNRHQVAWSAIDGAKGYELAFSTDQENWSSVMTSETAYTLSGLAYGEKVYYKVRGTSGDLSSDWSASSSLVVCPMDITGDGIISPADLTTFSLAMNSKRGDSRWDARCDVDGDGVVSASDLTYISMNWLSRSTSEKLTFPTAAADVADVTTLDLDLSFVDEDADAEDFLFEEIF